MIRKAIRFLIPAGLGVLLASNWTDIKRYSLMTLASRGHPELVPVRGRAAYPQGPGKATPDGTGEFDAALRGAPASAP